MLQGSGGAMGKVTHPSRGERANLALTGVKCHFYGCLVIEIACRTVEVMKRHEGLPKDVDETHDNS